MNSELKRVLGVTGDRLRVSSSPTPSATDPGHTEELALYVNGGGIILALTPEQVNQRLSLAGNAQAINTTNKPADQAQPERPKAPGDPSLGDYQQT